MKVKTGEDNIRYLLGLTPKQYEMFVKLNEVNEHDLSSREIQNLTGLDASVITRTLSVLLKQGLVKREYALRGDAPPHYRYKTVSVEEFEEKTILAAEEFTEKVKKELGRN
tara:strand:- start:359 stop:691 length:333 start_codon:yes stop_codon:yes gene_type:complete